MLLFMHTSGLHLPYTGSTHPTLARGFRVGILYRYCSLSRSKWVGVRTVEAPCPNHECREKLLASLSSVQYLVVGRCLLLPVACCGVYCCVLRSKQHNCIRWWRTASLLLLYSYLYLTVQRPAPSCERRYRTCSCAAFY